MHERNYCRNMVKVEKIDMHAVNCNFFEQRFSIIYCTCFFQDPTLKKKSGKLVSKRKLFLQNGQGLQINKGIPWFIVMHAWAECRVCTHLESPRKLQLLLENPWISVLTLSNPNHCKVLEFLFRKGYEPHVCSVIWELLSKGVGRWFVELALYTVQKYIVSEAV